MRQFLIILSLFLSAKAFAETPHIYLLLGQSNMDGRSPLLEEDEKVVPGCYLFNGRNGWEGAKNPLNRYSTIKKESPAPQMGPGYTFCKKMLEHDSKTPIGLVVNARGGTSITEWTRGGEYYSEAIRRVRLAQRSGKLMGILWHQGENDARDDSYFEKLKQLVLDFRSDLGNEKLLFIAGQVNNNPKVVVNEEIAKLSRSLPYTDVVSSEGLTVMDDWHFDRAIMLILGSRYAEAIIVNESK